MSTGVKPSVLLVDDDAALCDVLARGFVALGYTARTASTYAEALQAIDQDPPTDAVVDVRVSGGSGLRLISQLKAARPEVRIVVLTGYGSVQTAVEAIKLGANYYLAKPATLDEIVAALDRDAADGDTTVSGRPMSLGRHEWEYIERILGQYGGNVSATARALSMHRRTLQRKIGKHPTRG